MVKQKVNKKVVDVHLVGGESVKITDSSGKGMCKDAVYLAYLKKTFGIKESSK